MQKFLLPSLLGFFMLAGSPGGAARADVLLDDTNLVGLASVAPPAELAFTTTEAQALNLTLTDFQQPAAFGTLQVAVTLGDTLVGSATVSATTHTATLAIPAAIGNYVLHVIGTPDTTQLVGSFGACVSLASDASGACIAADSFSGNIQTPSTASTLPTSSLNTNFTSTVAGTYTVTITDDVFPVALQSVSGGITSGSTPVNATGFALGTNTVTLAAGTNYTLLLGALADATVEAGLYSVAITDPTGAAVFARTLPVGTLQSATIVNNPAPQTLSLTLTDLMYPAALANIGVAVTSGSTLLAKLTASGANPAVVAPAGNLQIWQYDVSSGTPGVYSLMLTNATGSSSLFTTTQVVNPGASTASTSYAFVVALPAAGTYDVAVTDFQFPSALAATPTAVVAQNGAVLTQSSGGAFTASAGNVVVLVNAAAPTSGSGIFGVTVQTSGATPTLLLDQTQSVGATFTTQSATVTTAGSYDVTLADLGFPANFASLAVLVSQGNQVLGKIFGGGTFTFSATAGTYVLTFVDTPSATAANATSTPGYGLYSVHVASSAPTVTFTSSAASVTAGQSVTLTWSTTNATACTASGSTAWSGTEPTSGSASVVISATAALVLTCSGPGGSAAQTVNITATPAATSSHGGGSLDMDVIAGLAGLWLTGAWRRRHMSRHCKNSG